MCSIVSHQVTGYFMKAALDTPPCTASFFRSYARLDETGFESVRRVNPFTFHGLQNLPLNLCVLVEKVLSAAPRRTEPLHLISSMIARSFLVLSGSWSSRHICHVLASERNAVEKRPESCQPAWPW